MDRKNSKHAIVERIKTILDREKRTLSLAESCTGGLVSSLLTDVPGSSGFFTGSVISYSDKVKEEQLKVSSEVITKHGAVSREVAKLMAKGARSSLRSDIAASITGIAGPDGGTKSKPVGEAYIAFDDGKEQKTKKIHCKGTRVEIKEKFAEAVLSFILENIGRT